MKKITCPICGENFTTITASHLRQKHDMTRGEFVAMYPDSYKDVQGYGYDNRRFRKVDPVEAMIDSYVIDSIRRAGAGWR